MPDSMPGDSWEMGKSLRFFCPSFVKESLALCLTIIVETTHNVGSIAPMSVGKS